MGPDGYLWSPEPLERVVRAAAARRPETRLLYGRVALVNRQEEALEVVGGPRRRKSRRWLSDEALAAESLKTSARP